MDFLDTKAMLALLERIATALEAIAPKQAEPEQATTEEEKSE